MRRLSILAVFISLAAPSMGCGDDESAQANEAPQFSALSDHTAYVNVEFGLSLQAYDPDGDQLTFSYASDIADIDSRATLEKTASDRAQFTWMPLVSDIGQHAFDFTVSDGQNTTQETITIDVVWQGEGSTAPVFVQPLGTGTTLDLTVQGCIEVPIVVEDPDSGTVNLGQEDPVIEGATLTQADELTGSWNFCPSQAQIAADDRYTVVFSADDSDNPKTEKPYLVVLRTDSKGTCPGDPPVITHTPQDVQSIVDLTVTAQVTDDVGIKYEPLLYYSLNSPGSDPDVAQMTQLTMTLSSGSMSDGTWSATVPNPVASQPAGSSAQVYYVIVAQDNDDGQGACDHLTQAPATGSYQLTVTNPGGQGGLGLCEPCTADAQCGNQGDNCVYFDGDHHCFQACSSDTDCPTDYYCSITEFTSIDGAKARQCIPEDYQCNGSSPGCVDDSYEDNDSLQEALAKPELLSGSYPNLKSCPGQVSGDDEDWYRIVTTGDTLIDVSIVGGSATDLDLSLYDTNGTLVEKSTTLTSSESISTCQTAGTYYVRVYAWSAAENDYTLTYSPSSQSCSSACSDDGNEDDDNASQARFVDLATPPYTSTTDAICAYDDDWFEVPMYAGESIYATLIFEQNASLEDLDLHVYDSNSTKLTGCCDVNNGQSADSNEELEWPISTTGTYYVVVRGYQGSENLYDICISYQSGDCVLPP